MILNKVKVQNQTLMFQEQKHKRKPISLIALTDQFTLIMVAYRKKHGNV